MPVGDQSLRVLRDTFATEDRTDWTPHGGGGIWRRRQIDAILRRRGSEPVNMERPTEASISVRLLRALALKVRFYDSTLWTRRSLGHAEYSYRYYGHNARRPGLAPVALLETGTDPVAIAALKDAGFRVIAVLNAINSLWCARPSELIGPYPRMFLAETHALQKVDAVFCISREEQWLLNNIGIPAQYLPYFPDPERAKMLVAERETRPPLPKSGPRQFMICATRGNSTTIDAFREQAEWICRDVAERDAMFHVTGHQTEHIKDIWMDKRFVFHGTCTDEKFQAVKRDCVAICLHQREGVGALTRVPDMILAGLSVIANGPSARSFMDMAGVHAYDTPSQLHDLLHSDLPMPPLPQRPIELEDVFFSSLRLQ